MDAIGMPIFATIGIFSQGSDGFQLLRLLVVQISGLPRPANRSCGFLKALLLPNPASSKLAFWLRVLEKKNSMNQVI